MPGRSVLSRAADVPENCPLKAIVLTAEERALLRKRWRHSTAAAALLGVAVSSTLVGIGWGLWLNKRAPLEYLNSRLVSNVLRPDEDLRFLVTAASYVDQACLGSITREFYTSIDIDVDGTGKPRKVRLKKHTFGPAPIVHKGETEYAIDLPLPENMPAGLWSFQGETTYDCGFIWGLVNDFPRGLLGGGVLRLRTPEMPFTVLAKAP